MATGGRQAGGYSCPKRRSYRCQTRPTGPHCRPHRLPHVMGRLALDDLNTVPGPRGRELLERRIAVVSRALAVGLPLFATSGDGATITDVDGQRYVDFAGGVGVLNAGHAPAQVIAAITDQITRLLHTDFPVVMYEPYVQLAERLAAISPTVSPTKVLLLNSGAEAVENAIKIARYASKRQAIVCFSHAFHGRTYMALSLTSSSTRAKSGFAPFAPEVYRSPFPYAYRGITAEAALASLHHLVVHEIGGDNVAAVIIELVPGEGGFLVAPERFVKGVCRLCRKENIILVVDEVQSGFGRTGRMFASEHYQLEPDLVCLGKSLGGGLPLSAVVGRADLMDAPPPGGLGSTFGGNPVACAAGLASLQIIMDQGLVGRAAELGRQVGEQFQTMKQRHRLIGDVRGLGAMQAIELVRDRSSREPAPAETLAVIAASARRGVVLAGGGTNGNVIRFMAPLVITPEELTRGLRGLDDAVSEVSSAC